MPTTGQLATERGKSGIEQQIPGLGHSPAQHDQLGVENGGYRGQALADPYTEVGQQLDRRGITFGGCSGDVRPAQGGRVASAQLAQTRSERCPGDDELPCLSHQSGAAGVLLPTAAIAATATDSIRHHTHVAQLGRHAEGPAQQDAVDHDAAPDSGADGKQDHVVRLSAATETELAPGRSAGVILDDDGQVEDRLETRLERFVPPRQVGGEEHRGPRTVDEAGTGDADSVDLVLEGQLPDQVGCLLRYGRRIVGRGVLASLGQNHPAPVDDATIDLGATDVQPDRRAHLRHPSYPSSTGMSWTVVRSDGLPEAGLAVLGVGPDARDWVATSRRLAATAETRSASRSTVSGRTERSNAMP